MQKISVIVPVYKVEKYLKKCVDSIMGQTFKDFECLLTDDGSIDNCGTMLDEYALSDSRNIVIHQKNGGVSSARNKGLDIMCGDYVGFVDPDDWIEPQMYETMLNATDNGKYDIVACGFNYFDVNYCFISQNFMDERIYDKKDIIKDLFNTPTTLGGCVWNKIYSVNCIFNLYFDIELSNGEDRNFLLIVFQKCKKLKKISNTLYNVYFSYNSASRTNSLKTVKKSLNGRKQLIKNAHRISKEIEGMAICRYIDDCFLYFVKDLKKYNYLFFLKLKFQIILYLFYGKLFCNIKTSKFHSFLLSWLKTW